MTQSQIENLPSAPRRLSQYCTRATSPSPSATRKYRGCICDAFDGIWNCFSRSMQRSSLLIEIVSRSFCTRAVRAAYMKWAGTVFTNALFWAVGGVALFAFDIVCTAITHRAFDSCYFTHCVAHCLWNSQFYLMPSMAKSNRCALIILNKHGFLL